MSLNDSDPTCVARILENFKRKAEPNTFESPVTLNAVTKLNFEMDPTTPLNSRKRKIPGDVYSSEPKNVALDPTSESPWETHSLRTELLDAKVQISALETRVNQLHALRRELEIVFEAEKTSFLQQQERDSMKIKTLESKLAQLRRREADSRDDLLFQIKDLDEKKYQLEKSVLTLQRQKAEISNELSEMKQALKGAENQAITFEEKLKSLECSCNCNLEKKGQREVEEEVLQNQSSKIEHNEVILFELKEAQRRLKNLETELKTNEEASEFVKSQQHKLFQIPVLERDIEVLKSDNAKLREAVHNKVLLEEEVADLKQKCASNIDLERRLVELEAQQQICDRELCQWRTLVQDFCTDVTSKDVCPSVLRHRIQDLQQSELLLTAEVATFQMKLKIEQGEKSKLDAQLLRVTEEMKRLRVLQEQQANVIRRWQKKLALITGERNSYRDQLDLYEKELTISGTGNQQQISLARLEALEKSLEGYRELVQSLESELAAAVGQGGLVEKVRSVTAERDILKNDLIAVKKKNDELQRQLEEQIVSGGVNLKTSKILHLKMNPVSDADEERCREVAALKIEVATLKERLRLIQEGEQDDITVKVNKRLVSSGSQEIQELKDQVKSADLMIQRLKEAFKSTSSEFRDCVYQLLGYNVVRLQNKGMFKLSSMYAESSNDYLLFKMESNGTFTLLETPFSASVGELIDLHLRQQGSLPTFLAAITMDLFSRQSLMMSVTSAVTEEPIVLD